MDTEKIKELSERLHTLNIYRDSLIKQGDQISDGEGEEQLPIKIYIDEAVYDLSTMSYQLKLIRDITDNIQTEIEAVKTEIYNIMYNNITPNARPV